MNVEKAKEELDNLKLFILPEVEGCLSDILKMQDSDPDWEYREDDERDIRIELNYVKSRIASLEKRLTHAAPDGQQVAPKSEGSPTIPPVS